MARRPKGRQRRGGNIYTSKSKIHGNGIFTNKNYNAGDVIGVSHTNNKGYWNMHNVGNYNHSNNPNCKVQTNGNNNYLVAGRKLGKGEEITVDYKKQPYLEQPKNGWK